jgi:hypothetical protein
MNATRILRRRLVSFWVGIGLVFGLTGCGGPPNWVKEGSGAYSKDGVRAIYGVGSIVGIKNEPLAWDAAENRARAEIAKNFETYTAYLMRDYTASTNAADFSQSTEEQHVERAIKTFTATTLRGVRPIDRYKDEDTYSYYVLAQLSLDDMQSLLGQSQELDAGVRDYVRENAERLFDQLEKEEAKRKSGQ